MNHTQWRQKQFKSGGAQRRKKFTMPLHALFRGALVPWGTTSVCLSVRPYFCDVGGLW